MSMGKEQERRLMELLSKLAARGAGEPVPNLLGSMPRMPDFGGQEHTDTKTLVHMGWIRSRRGFTDVTNSWSAEGIFAFDLTDDGRAALEAWSSSANTEVGHSEDGQIMRTRPRVMVIHGSSDGQVPRVVEDIRLWCFENGMDAYKAADLPNSGRFVNDKVDSTINEADYYIVVLTADEELVTGEFRPRPNAIAEMGRVIAAHQNLVCVLKDDKVEILSDYRGLVTEPLVNWQAVLQRELREAGLL